MRWVRYLLNLHNHRDLFLKVGINLPVLFIYVLYSSPNFKSSIDSSLLILKKIIMVRPANQVTPINQFAVRKNTATWSK